MSGLASMLAGILNRPVYDRTNLTGNYDFQVEYTPDQMPQIPAGATLPPGFTLPPADGPSLNTALREQLASSWTRRAGRSMSSSSTPWNNRRPVEPISDLAPQP